jgi:hypothetical protein
MNIYYWLFVLDVDDLQRFVDKNVSFLILFFNFKKLIRKKWERDKIK